MSVALMSLAFKAPLPSTRKLVLLALCDSANDQGECYPSVTALVDKCSLSDRAIQQAIGELEDAGYLRREFRKGRSTTYWMTPAAGSPPNHVPPERCSPAPEPRSPLPPNVVHPTPEPRSPRTIKEPSEEPSGKQKKAAPQSVAPTVLIAAGFDADAAAEFIAHKARMRAPLTARAWADHCAEARKAGWSPQAAAEKVMARSWKGFDAKYVANEARPSGADTEPAWRTEQRKRNEAFLGPASATRRAAPKQTQETVDVIAIRVD